MTFCLGLNLEAGLIGISDTRVVTGTECITARKVATYQQKGYSMFVMTSGLRSLRDKTLTYFDDLLAAQDTPYDRLFKAANAFASQLRRVAEEDAGPLKESGFSFDMQALIGGQLSEDDRHHLYLVYPQGNWVEIGEGTPYHIIGSPGYGKPVLDRTLKYHDSMRFAFKVGCLAFDSTRISAADVDFPIDVVLYPRNTLQLVECRYGKDDLIDISNWWEERLRRSVAELPSEWIEHAFSKLAPIRELRSIGGE